MKLQTSIPPRRDGTVRVLGLDRQTYVFVAGEDGELTGEVTDEATVAFLLESQNFWPADPEDAERALDLVKKPAAEGEEGGDGDDDDGDDDGEDDEDAPPALPIEANTPPAPARKTAARKTAAK